MRLAINVAHAVISNLGVNRDERAGTETVVFDVAIPAGAIPDRSNFHRVTEILFTDTDVQGAPLRFRQFPGPYYVRGKTIDRSTSSFRCAVTLAVPAERAPDRAARRGRRDLTPLIDGATGPIRIGAEDARPIDLTALGALASEITGVLRDTYGEGFSVALPGMDAEGGFAARIVVDLARDALRIEKAPGDYMEVPLAGLARALLDPDMARQVAEPPQIDQPTTRRRRRIRGAQGRN